MRVVRRRVIVTVAVATTAVLLSAVAAVRASTSPGPTVDSLTPRQQVMLAASAPVVAVYTLEIGSRGGFSGVVTLTAIGQPAGASVSFTPVTLPPSPLPATRSSTLTVTLPAATTPGSYRITIKATAPGAGQDTDEVRLVVQPQPAVFVDASPSTVTIGQGEKARYNVVVTRVSLPGQVNLSTGALPPGVTATFSVNALTGTARQSTLTLRTTSATPGGTYPITITATSGSLSDQTDLELVVRDLSRQLRIAFQVPEPLILDRPAPLNLLLTNTGTVPLTVTGLEIRMTAIDAAHSSCQFEAPNFVIAQLPADQLPRLVLSAGRSKTLRQLGVPAASLPTITFENDPNRDQTDCAGATFTLTYTGTASGASSGDR